MSAMWVVVDAVRGSAPRDAGTAMKVTPDSIEGTIGGGALEYTAIAEARKALACQAPETTRTYPLGPGLGQCCGGAVSLRYTRTKHALDVGEVPVHKALPTQVQPQSLWIWGAGHVGRAVVHALHPQTFKITWVDSSDDRFPVRDAKHITKVPATDMATLAARAPKYAHHLIFTYSHDIDFALCAALLKRGGASIGLIGSDTKRTRFFKRLRDMGLDPAPITCPIGDKRLGKAPAAIAQGVAAALMSKGDAA